MKRRICAFFTVAMLVAPASHAVADDGADGLRVTYPDGELRLGDLAPGQTLVGDAAVTNHHDEPAQLHATSTLRGPALTQLGLELHADVCRQAWTDDACADPVGELPLSGAETFFGQIDANDTWFVRFRASFADDAPSSAQGEKANFHIDLHASNGPIDGQGSDTNDASDRDTGNASNDDTQLASDRNTGNASNDDTQVASDDVTQVASNQDSHDASDSGGRLPLTGANLWLLLAAAIGFLGVGDWLRSRRVRTTTS